MKLYNKFIGIDIGKCNFVVGVHGNKEAKEYVNDSSGIAEFIKEYIKTLLMRFVFWKLPVATKWLYY